LKSVLGQLPSDHELGLTILRDGKEVRITVQPGQ